MVLRRGFVSLACALALACGDPEEDRAPVDPNAFAIGPGFAPDPQIKTGMAGGPVEASQRNPDCRGWIPPRPNHTLVLSAPFPQLRIVIHSTGDPTLVVALADGRVLCNDDSEGLNSMVEGSFPAGTHQVFVGTYGQGPAAPYSIGVSQGRTLLPSMIAAHTAPAPPMPPQPPPQPPPTMDPPLAPPGVPSGPQPPLELVPGFRPDPQLQASWAGGTTAAATIDGSCVGFVPSMPQHTLLLRHPLENLRLLVSSDLDATLLIRRPDGTVVCNDDSDGVNPAWAGPFAPGAHQVFVGTYGQGQGGAYRVAVTTNMALSAAELAAMGEPSAIVGPGPDVPLPPPPFIEPSMPPGGRLVPGALPGDMNPQGLTAAQRASADANGISYYEARELHRCRACMREQDFDRCLYACREPCLDCLSGATPTESVCGPPCGGRR